MGQVDNSSSVNKRNNIIVIVLAVLLVVVVGIYFWQRNEYTTIIKQINADKDAISTELSQMVLGYDSLRTENDTINQNLMIAQTQVRDLLLEVNQVKQASYEQISQYREEVTSLRKIMRTYIVQIDSLNRRNQQLLAENVQVKQQFQKEKTRATQLEKEKEKLEQKVNLAAQLEALNLMATGINHKGKDTPKSSKIRKIRVSFTLSKNVTAKRGAKKLYVRIQRPDEVLLLKSEKDVFRFEDLKIPYSATREVEYEGESLPVNVFWDNTNEPRLMTGKYTVDVFADGNNIGTTTFLIK